MATGGSAGAVATGGWASAVRPPAARVGDGMGGMGLSAAWAARQAWAAGHGRHGRGRHRRQGAGGMPAGAARQSDSTRQVAARSSRPHDSHAVSDGTPSGRVCTPVARQHASVHRSGGRPILRRDRTRGTSKLRSAARPATLHRDSAHPGEVEAKEYTGGMDRAATGTTCPADGLYTGGVANNSNNGYNIYFSAPITRRNILFEHRLEPGARPRASIR